MAYIAGRFVACRIIDLFAPGAGMYLEAADAMALIVVCSRLFLCGVFWSVLEAHQTFR
jgi:hypothetical protein